MEYDGTEYNPERIDVSEVTSRECFVVTDPYIAPEHRELIEKAEKQLREYDDALLAKLKSRLWRGETIPPRPADVQRAQEEFERDLFRCIMIQYIVDMRMIFERPRLIVVKP